MSEALLRMYISFGAIALLLIASGLILWSRMKLKGLVSAIVATLAYLCFILGTLIIVLIVFSGPTF